jgi:hypothetical protein
MSSEAKAVASTARVRVRVFIIFEDGEGRGEFWLCVCREGGGEEGICECVKVAGEKGKETGESPRRPLRTGLDTVHPSAAKRWTHGTFARGGAKRVVGGNGGGRGKYV